MWILTLALGVLVYFLFRYWVNGYFHYWESKGIPHSNASPLNMIIKYIFTKKGLLELIMDDYKRLDGKKFGGYFQMFSPAVMIRDPELINRICIKDFSHFVDRNFKSETIDLFTQSIGSLTGDQWRTVRHKMTTGFTSGKLKLMFNTIRENADEVIEFIEKKEGHDIEARDFMFKFVINVIGNVAFGLKVDALNEATEKDNEFLKISKLFFQPSFILLLKFTIVTTMPKVRKYFKFTLADESIEEFFRKLTKDMIELREKSGDVRHDFLQIMIDQKNKEQLAASSNAYNKSTQLPTDDDIVEPEDKELLDQLNIMKDGNDGYQTTKVFTDECIAAQAFMFISAGSETTAAALCFTLFELAVNSDLQKRMQKEIDDSISKHGFNYQAVRNMKFMEQFISETLRRHTLASFLGRVCTQSYNIPDTDVVIDKGSFIVLPTIGISNDPQHFPNPEKFDPSRFDEANAPSELAQLAFGIGPRMCIAKRLAILQIKILLATVLQKYDINLSKKTTLPLKIQKSSVFQHVIGGVWVQFQKRKL